MFVSDCLGINAKGHLTIDGKDALELAGEYGTPLYAMSETQIRENCRKFRRSLEEHYSGNGLALYASKAFCCKAICNIVREEGLGLDVVSGGELYTAQSVGFPAKRIYFHGNNKTPEELLEALRYGVGSIVVDNITELEILDQIAASLGKTADIMFRVKPGVDAHTHDFIRTGQIDSKFGVALETGEAMEAVRRAAELGHIRLMGLHCHIGSQIFDIAPFEEAARVMLRFLSDVRRETGMVLKRLNLGGGFGIKYTPENDPAGLETYMARVSGAVHEECGALDFPMPFILIEPGRSIVGDAGITLYRVGSVKTIPGVRTYLSVDGGMTDNPRYALYQARYEALIASRAGEAKTMEVTLAGRCCESGDLIGEGMMLQPAVPGDIVAVLSTGAYNYSMASNYNRVPRPPVVMVRDGVPRVAVRRETLEDLVNHDEL